MNQADFAPLIAGVLLLVGLGALWFRTVPQAEVWVTEVFGKFNRIVNPGLNVIFQPVEQAAYRFTTREQYIPNIIVRTYTKNNVLVTLDTALFYKIVNPKLAAYGVVLVKDENGNVNHKTALRLLSDSTLRGIGGQMTFDDMMDNQAVINDRVQGILRDAVQPWGLIITRHEINDLQGPPEVMAAFLAQIQAEKEKVAAITRAEAIARATVIAAEANLTKAQREADADLYTKTKAAEATVAIQKMDAEGEAVALERTAAILTTREGKVAAKYRLREEEIDAMKALAQSKGLVLLPAGNKGLSDLIATFAAVTSKVDDSVKP